ncbi:unnamed protein product [Rotaria sp. Silwood1]|nr:unnamed protein product [Rotaria sp. Silwood1]
MSSLDEIELLRVISKEYQFYSSIIILFIGLIGNILIILMFSISRIFRGNQCAYYLKIESTTDIGLLLAILPSNIAGYIIGQDPVRISVIWCKIQLMSSYSFGLYSLFTICFLAFDQYLSTNHRQNWRHISTLKLAYRLTYFNISIALIHGILFLVFAEIGPLGCTVYHPTINFYLFLILSPRYRNQVKHFFIKIIRRSWTRLSNPRLTIPRNNQIAPEPAQASAFIIESV